MKKQNIFGGVMVLAILLAFGLACNQYGEKLEFNGGELYHTENVTEAEAKKLGEYLVKEQFFDGKEKTVQLDKQGGTYQFKMVVIEDKRNDDSTLELFKTFASQISADVFDNAPTELHVCNEKLETLKVVKP
jgi:preprotein translocase subunit SecF